MTGEEDDFAWSDANDSNTIPSLDDDFAKPDELPSKDDNAQIDRLMDDMGMEPPSKTESEDANMNMLLKAAGWHPFLHLFVRVSNMMYGNYPEWQRPSILAREHERWFRYSWFSDQVVQWACVIGVLLFIGATAWKALFT